MDEFEMISHGDRILVAISCSASSLSLLHALRQFSRARNIPVQLGVCSIGAPGIDPRALMLYLSDLGIKYHYEERTTESLKEKLAYVARKYKYNVLALGTTLDKLANDFITSLMTKGQLSVSPANCFSSSDLRIIRPFVYQRERTLELFSRQKDLPSRPSRFLNNFQNNSYSLLQAQEAINPAVYENIKNGLKPLLALRSEHPGSTYEYLKMALTARK